MRHPNYRLSKHRLSKHRLFGHHHLRRFTVGLILPVLLMAGPASGDSITSIVDGEAGIAATPEDPIAYIDFADFLMRQGKHKDAATVLEKGQVKALPSPDLLVKLGLAYEGQGFFARAEAITREALVLDPNHVMAYLRMGEIYFRLGWNKSGLESLRQAVALAPEDDLPKVRLVGALCRDKQLAAAEDQCLEFISTNNQSPDLWLSLGQVFEEQERRRQAFTTYGQVLTIDPENSLAFARQGRLFCQFGQFTSAESACRKALELDPDNALGHAYLGIACAKLGQNDEARIHAEIAEDAGLNMLSVWRILNN